MGFVVSSLIKITYIFCLRQIERHYSSYLKMFQQDASVFLYRSHRWSLSDALFSEGVVEVWLDRWVTPDTSVREHVIGYIAYRDTSLWPTIYLSCTLLTYLRLFHSSVFDSFLNLKYIHAYVQLAFSFHPNSLECGAFHNATWFFFDITSTIAIQLGESIDLGRLAQSNVNWLSPV